ncbi:unnamed protein product [Prunus armeniaca]
MDLYSMMGNGWEMDFIKANPTFFIFILFYKYKQLRGRGVYTNIHWVLEFQTFAYIDGGGRAQPFEVYSTGNLTFLSPSLKEHSPLKCNTTTTARVKTQLVGLRFSFCFL